MTKIPEVHIYYDVELNQPLHHDIKNPQIIKRQSSRLLHILSLIFTLIFILSTALFCSPHARNLIKQASTDLKNASIRTFGSYYNLNYPFIRYETPSQTNNETTISISPTITKTIIEEETIKSSYINSWFPLSLRKRQSSKPSTIPSTVNIIFPLYIYPMDITSKNKKTTYSWQPLLDQIKNYPKLGFIIIVNANSGPGKAIDPGYTDAIKRLKQNSNVKIVGYVNQLWGNRPKSEVLNDVLKWGKFYPNTLDGIFLDEGMVDYSTSYTIDINSSIKKFGKKQGFATDKLIVVQNPGCITVEKMTIEASKLADIIVFQESAHKDYNSQRSYIEPKMKSAVERYGRYRFAWMDLGYNENGLQKLLQDYMVPRAAHIFVTGYNPDKAYQIFWDKFGSLCGIANSLVSKYK